VIEPGEHYQYTLMIFEGETSTHHTCLFCAKIAKELLGCFGVETVWETIHEHYCEDGCICELPTIIERQRQKKLSKPIRKSDGETFAGPNPASAT